MPKVGLVPGEPREAELLEAAYRLDRHELDWVEGVRQAFAPSAPGAALVLAFLYDAGDLRLTSVRGGSEAQRHWLESLGPRAPAAGEPARCAFEGEAGLRVSSEGPRRPAGAWCANEWGLTDSWSVYGSDGRGRGLVVSALSSRPVAPLAPGLVARWQSVAAHLSAAFRLRQAMAAGLLPGGSPGGRGEPVAAREALGRAVVAIDRARRRVEPTSAEAQRAWRALVEGRWGLVAQAAGDGRRLLLARVNEPPVQAAARLSEREAQVLGLAAEGWSNKQIGYRLGVGPAAVTNYLKRAGHKLGVSNRADLVRYALRGARP